MITINALIISSVKYSAQLKIFSDPFLTGNKNITKIDRYTKYKILCMYLLPTNANTYIPNYDIKDFDCQFCIKIKHMK